MPNKIQFIRDLLDRFGTEAEKWAVGNVRQHGLDTGNEKLITGPRNATSIPELTQSLGGPKSVDWPRNFQDLKQQRAQQGNELFSAHNHPDWTTAPSQADLQTWNNDYYVPDLKKQGTYLRPDQYGRDRMWIAGSNSSNDTLMMPPLEYKPYHETYETIRKMRDYGTTYNQNTIRGTPRSYDLHGKFLDFTKPWLSQSNTDPQEYARIYDGLAKSSLINKYAGEAPIMMDSATQLSKSRPDLTVSDVYPEWLKYLDDKGDPIFKAEGGQYAGGGKVAQMIRGVLARFDHMPSEDGYVYHATNTDRLADIAETKLKTHKPWEFTDQSSWPDGSVEKRAYFATRPDIAANFAPEEGNPALLRARVSDAMKRESGTGDYFTPKPVPPKDLEYLHESGTWHPVLSLLGDDE